MRNYLGIIIQISYAIPYQEILEFLENYNSCQEMY